MTFSPKLQNHTRRCPWLYLVMLVGFLNGSHAAKSAEGLISNVVAAQHGLERAWFSHVRVDPSRFRVANWTLDKDQLFALTTEGTLQALNAETGETLWVTDIASRNASTIGLALSPDYVAVLSASRLNLLERSDGRLIWSRAVGAAPSASPAIGTRYAYVALLSGRIEGYELENPKSSIWQYQSSGRSYHSPVTTGNVVSWPTDQGFLYVSSIENPRPLFRIHTNDEIVAAPAKLAPYLYVASLDGYLYCFHEFTGKEMWRYSTGFAVTSRPAIVGEMAFVASEETAIHAIDSTNGKRIWRIDGVADFVAMGANAIYGMAPYGTLVVLDKATGKISGKIRTTPKHSAIVNDQSDRIFMVNDQGAVQCLREIGASQPTWYRQQEKEPASDPETEDDSVNPFAEEAADRVDDAPDATPVDDNPFDKDESESIFDGDNPF